jgi:rhamnosyltransferase
MPVVNPSQVILLVVAYHPPAELLPRLQAVLHAGVGLAIYDNSPAGAQLLQPLYKQCFWHHAAGTNDGLGVAMQVLLKEAKKSDCNWALYVDQDTCFSVHSLAWMAERLQENEGKFLKTAAVQFKGGASFSSLTVQPLLINSGSAFYLPNLAAWGGPDPSFFVECVDYKFCLDAAYAGFELWQATGCPDFDHERLQPVLRYPWRKGTVAFRPYPWQRHKSFVKALLRLIYIAASRKQFVYTRIFARNILTHLSTQLLAELFKQGARLGVVKKSVPL